MTELPPLVAVQGVHKSFLHEGREVEVLRDIDLTIERGEMLAVVGPSGAGKSTLLHLLGTLDLPTTGQVRYEGNDVTRYGSAKLAVFRNRSLGFVFQFHHLLPEFTALENVMMPGLIRGDGQRKLRERAAELLTDVRLDHRLTHRPGELSGGEQQRVALARALIMEPKLVLADEPTGNLDSVTGEAIHRLFTELNEKRGTTFLIVTHSQDLAARMPRRVAMRDGRIESDERIDRASYQPFVAADPDDHPEPEAAEESALEAALEAAEESGPEPEAEHPNEALERPEADVGLP